MNKNIIEVTDDSFENDVINSTTPTLIDFWAEWCGPCKMLNPIIDEIANNYAGKLKVAKMNVDQNNSIPAKYGVRGIPTLLLFKDGDVAATQVGALSKAQLTQFLDKHL